jgi:radical SAM superfamily enzyme YgiQ (UPF0313 family)
MGHPFQDGHFFAPPRLPQARCPCYYSSMSTSAAALLIQAPFTQLNAPYPAVFYLRSFLESRGTACAVSDLAIKTIRSIFSRAGLKKIFEDGERALSAGKLEKADAATRENLARYLSSADAYVNQIDCLMAFLSGRLPDYRHALADPGRLPHGYRVERYLDGLEAPPEPAIVATLTLEDLADFITFTLDPDFALVRYAESKAASQPSYDPVLRAVRESYVIREFVRLLAKSCLAESPSPLVCVSVPFPGCLAPAIAILEEAKAAGARTAMGGGYVSTELRFIRDRRFFDSVDFLCFDSGFNTLASIVDGIAEDAIEDTPLYRSMRVKAGKIRVEGFPPESAPDYADASVYDFLSAPDEAERRASEDSELTRVFPDYAGLDLGDYLRLDDSGNPMHALWSNGTWLKCRLAYGCYWGRCLFCDGCLDYINHYRPAKAIDLHARMLAQAQALGAGGIHFVDEAAPVPLLLAFARENARTGRRLSFWGNTRFERLFTKDRAEFLSWSGFLAASAGIEAAGENGLGLSGKGLSMTDIVSACDALSGAGILVHAYLMYGLPDQTDADVMDSLEILRQMFRLGLIHSAFWHPFVLARHSPFYRDRFSRGDAIMPKSDFALNDLDWRGSGKLARYSEGIEAALAAFMSGEDLDKPVGDWFDFKTPSVAIERDYVKKLRNAARAEATHAPRPPSAEAVWLGGRLIRTATKGALATLSWSYLNRVEEISLPSSAVAALAEILAAADPAVAEPPHAAALKAAIEGLAEGGVDIYAALKKHGLLSI